MNVLNDLFRSLEFTKVKVVDSYALYMAKIQTFTGNGRRYVIAAVPFDKAHYPQTSLMNLPWVSVQTRTLADEYNIPEQILNHRILDHRFSDNKIKFSVINRSNTSSDYVSQVPLELSILHDPKKKSLYQYPDTIELRQALNTFQCVVKRL